LPALGLAVLGLVSSGLLDLFPSLVRFLVVIGVLVFLPGELVLRFLRVRAAAVVRIPLGFVAGVSLWCGVTWVCRMGGAPFTPYVVALQVVCAGLFAASLFRVPGLLRPALDRQTAGEQQVAGRREAAGDWGAAGDRGEVRDTVNRRGTAVLLLIALCVSIFFIVTAPPLRHDGDAFVHLGLLRGIDTENTLAPEDPLAPPIYAVEGPGKSDPRVGALHPLLAAIARLSRLDPLEVWRWLPVAIAPVGFLAFAGFAAVLLPGAGYVAFALVLFLMFQGGIGREFFGAIAYGQHLSLVFFWLFVVVSLRYARDGRTGGLVLAGLLVFGGALVHVDVLIHWALALASFLVLRKAFGFTWRRALVLALVTSVCAGIVAAWRVATTYEGGNVLHSHPQGLLYFFDIGDRFFIPSPAEIVRKNGLLFFAAFLFIPFLPLLKRHRRYGLMSFSLSLPPIVTALNPFLCPILYGKLYYLVHRFLLNIPSVIITALAVGALVSSARRGGLGRKAFCAALIFLWARVFVVAAGGWFDDVRAAERGRAAPAISAEMSEAARFINEKTPAKSVVLSDAVTSYVLAALSHAKVVAVLGQHGSPSDRYPLERLSAVHTVMSPYTSQLETVAAIRRFGVEYVVVNGAFDGPVHGFLADWDPNFKPVLEAKLGTLKNVFKRVYASDRVVIYRVESTSFDRLTWDPLAPYLDSPQGAMQACTGVGAGGVVSVAEMGVDPRKTLPGETLRVRVGYRREPRTKPLLPVTLRLRFEDKVYFEEAWRFPGDKFVRRFRERQEGIFRRFRVDHKPFGGYLTAQEWPDDRLCYEEIEVRLPRALGETVYEIQWQLVEEPLLPNFAFRDFLYNEDSYAGSPCAKIDVRRQLVR